MTTRGFRRATAALRASLEVISTASAPHEPLDDEDDLPPEEEAELERRFAESEEAEREGRLITWEALFPPSRLTG